jgi:hypothetical protein
MTVYVDKVAVLRRERAVLLEECQQAIQSGIRMGASVSPVQHDSTDTRRDLNARLTALDVEILKLGANPLD